MNAPFMPRTGALPAPVLTRSQRQVLELVVCGYTFGEIGKQLQITEGSAAQACDRIRRRFGARNVQHLCTLAAVLGFADSARVLAERDAAVRFGLIRMEGVNA